MTNKQWKKIYIIGGIAAIIVFSGTLFDIIFGSATSSNLLTLPHTAVERFAELQQNWFLGLYRLDFVNVIVTLLTIPVYFGLFAIHRKRCLPYASLALIVSLVGITIFVTANNALAMLDLSNSYYHATTTAQKLLFEGAGETLLIQGTHGSFGVFLGFFMSTIASIGFAIVMLFGGVFKKGISYLGIIGYTLLLVYIILVTFIPSLQEIATIIAAPGGIMAMIWLLLVGIKFIKIGKTQEYSTETE